MLWKDVKTRYSRLVVCFEGYMIVSVSIGRTRQKMSHTLLRIALLECLITSILLLLASIEFGFSARANRVDARKGIH